MQFPAFPRRIVHSGQEVALVLIVRSGHLHCLEYIFPVDDFFRLHVERFPLICTELDIFRFLLLYLPV